MKYRFTCILCPLGCAVEVNVENGEIVNVTGNTCPRGKEWAMEEMKNPKRVVITVISVSGGNLPVVSVKTDKPVPRDKVKSLMRYLAGVSVKAPIKAGDVLFKNPLGLDVNIVATRDA